MIVAQAKPVDYDKAVSTAKSKAPTKPVVHLSKHELRKIWDNYKIIADVKTDDGHFVRIASGTLNGYRYVSLREFYYHKGDGVYKPGKHGMRIPMKSPFYAESLSGVPAIKDVGAEFLENFIKAFDTAQSMELSDQANAMYISTYYDKRNAVKMKEIGNNEN